jgi:hypothetical protein
MEDGVARLDARILCLELYNEFLILRDDFMDSDSLCLRQVRLIYPQGKESRHQLDGVMDPPHKWYECYAENMCSCRELKLMRLE